MSTTLTLDRAIIASVNSGVGLMRSFLHFFRKFPGTAEEVLEASIGIEYHSDNNKIMDIDVSLGVETMISRKAL